MIFYFTATGNSLETAQVVAATTHDKLVDMGAATKTKRFETYVEQGENLGFVFPVYAWSTPGLVDDYLRNVRFITSNGKPYVPGYCWCVITCGKFVGDAASFFGKMLQKYQHIKLDASFSVKSVGNCVYLYAPPEGAKRIELLRKAHEQSLDVAQSIANKAMGHHEDRNPFGCLMSKATCKEDKPRSIESFHVDAALCNGCGICATVCPTNTIRMVDGLPVWEGGNCTQCLACLHRCPTAASQFGDKTAKRGRYINPVLRDRPVRDPRSIPTL